MWPRIVELMLGVWLTISPFVFRVPAERTAVRLVDYATGSLVVLVALLCYLPALRIAHVATLLAGLGLAVYGWSGTRGDAVDPVHQNHIITGLLLAVFAVVPTSASSPPPAFRRQLHREGLRERRAHGDPAEG